MGRFAAARTEALEVGAQAPDFTLRHTFDESFTPTPGKPLVIAFYVFDFGSF